MSSVRPDLTRSGPFPRCSTQSGPVRAGASRSVSTRLCPVRFASVCPGPVRYDLAQFRSVRSGSDWFTRSGSAQFDPDHLNIVHSGPNRSRSIRFGLVRLGPIRLYSASLCRALLGSAQSDLVRTVRYSIILHISIRLPRSVSALSSQSVSHRHPVLADRFVSARYDQQGMDTRTIPFIYQRTPYPSVTHLTTLRPTPTRPLPLRV